jgi:hypothetical protein
MNKILKLGIIGHSFKDNEKRVPIHPHDTENQYILIIIMD